MRFALGFKADAEGGYLPREGELMHALGGSFDD